MREPFGVKVSKSGSLKKTLLPNLALYQILKSYDPNLTENESRLLVRYLDFNYVQSDAVDYKEFTTKAFKLFERFELRETRELQLFFSSIPLTLSPDEIPSDATVHFNKEKVGPGTQMGPIPLPESPGPLPHSAAVQSSLIDYVLRIKKHYKILSKVDAEVAFKRMDTNKNTFISKAEFEDMAKKIIPEITDAMRLQLYRMFDKNNVGNFTLDQFIDIVINKVPHHLDRMELLIQKTDTYDQVIKEIISKLDFYKKKLSDVFGHQQFVKKQRVLDVFDAQLKVLDPNKRIPQMLDIIETDQPEGGGKAINLEELSEILNEHRPKKNNIFEMLEPESPTRGKFGYSEPSRDRIDQVIQGLRKSISQKSENAVYILFNKIDRNDDHLIEFPEFFYMLRKIDSKITEKEAKQIFNRVDTNRNDAISQGEFIEYFDIREYIDRDPSIINRVRNREARFDNILEEITRAITARKTTPEKFYNQPEDRISKSDFEKSFRILKIPTDFHNFNEFIKAIEHRQKPQFIDLSKLKLLLDQYYEQNKNVVTKDMSSISEVFIYDLLRYFNDIDPILVAYDRDKNSIISPAEFMIITKQIFGPQSYSNQDLDNIYKSLKGDDRELTRFNFQLRLIEVQDKYNETQNSMILGPTLNASLDMTSPRIPLPYSPSRPTGLTFDYTRMEGEQSMPGLPPSPSKTKLTPEEIKREDTKAVYVKLRELIHYKDEELIEELKTIDKDGKNVLHQNYVWRALKKLGAPDTSFTDAEKKLLFDQVAKSGETIFYLDFVRRVFPTKQMVSITTAKELVKELLNQQQIRKETLAMLIKEAFDGDLTKKLSPEQFEKFLSGRGLLLSEETVKSIFEEFDTNHQWDIGVDEFKAQFLKDGVDGAVKLKNNLKTFLKNLNKTTKEAFEPLLPPKSKEFEFKDFANALGKLNHDIKYVEIETLFDQIDADKSGKLSLDELAKVLDQPVEVKIESIDSSMIRKGIYKAVKSKYHGFDHFFNTFAVKSPGSLSLDEFGQMLKAIEVPYKDLRKDVGPMFEAICKGGGMYRVSKEDLEKFYDESTILLLFPVITQFRTTFLEYMKTHQQPAYYLTAKHCAKGDNELDIDDFKDLLKTIGFNADKDQAELIFNELDYSNDKKVTPSELRRSIASTIIDVVSLTETISTTLYRRGIDARVAFTQVNKNNDSGLNFGEFFDLLVKNLNLNLSVLEVEEIFEFALTGKNGRITLADFVNLFSSTKRVNPFLHNKEYMDNLTEESKKYYLDKYRGVMNAKGDMKAFSKNSDKELIDKRRRLGRAGAVEGFGFELSKVEPGDQSMPKNQMPETPMQVEEGEIGEVDIMFGLRLKSRGMDQKLEMTFKSLISDNANDKMVLDDLRRFVKDLNMTLSDEEIRYLFSSIHRFGKDDKDKVSLNTFLQYVKSVLEKIKKSKESGLNLRGIAGPAIKKYLIYEKKLPEDYFNSYKKRASDCLLFHEFTKMIEDLQLAIEPSHEEINRLFQFLIKNKEEEMLTYKEFLEIFNDPADLIAQINKIKYEGLLFEVKVD